MTEINWDHLVATAAAVRERAHAPYSRFRVGAAVLTSDGRVFAGCNVENRTYGLTICAERNALAQSVAAGAGAPIAAAVVAQLSPPAPPCGMCLESFTELAEDLPILLVNPAGEQRLTRLRELLPTPFRWKGPENR